MSAAVASASVVPWIGAGVAVYAAVFAAAVLLCAAGHEDEPAAVAVPAERRGALCVSRPATRPFSAPERGRLAELGLLAAAVLREQATVPPGAPVRGVPA
jgi:hypothetical protein